MNTKNKNLAAEKISACIDDALQTDEIESLLEANDLIEQSGSHFSLASRYHMVGDALRGELSDASMVDVSAAIHQAILHESFDATESVRSVKKSLLSESRFDFFAWLGTFARPLTGMAIAATVAMLMVVTVVQLESPEGVQQIAVSPASTPDAVVANKQSVDDLSKKERQMAEFDTYLTEHAEFAAQDTLQGRIPYVRAVSYEAE